MLSTARNWGKNFSLIRLSNNILHFQDGPHSIVIVRGFQPCFGALPLGVTSVQD